ncbi:MAG: nucleoside monophosphate kinase, partial [Promethearchaeia archaeon]
MPYRPDVIGSGGQVAPGVLVAEDAVLPVRACLMGGPGCGKHAVVRSLCDKHGLVHISVGAALREKVRQGADSSEVIAEYMAEGRLVPDELAISIVREKMNAPGVQERGWLLDNFPRTADQAEAMMELGIIPEKFIFINMPEDVLMARCLGRKVHPESGAVYHDRFEPFMPPPEVQATLVRREDDNEDAVARRLELFFEGSEDVLEIFKDISLELDGLGDRKELLRDAHLYIKPPAPLYADVSVRPAGTTAEALKAAFAKRAEESELREGEEAGEEVGGEGAGRPPLLGDEFRRELMRDMLDICLGERFDEEQERA